MPQQRFLYLSRADVERVGLDLPTIIALLERAFHEKAEGRVEMPPKPGIGRGSYSDHPALIWNSGIGYMEGLGRPGYREELELFARAIREGGAAHPNLEDAWQAMRVIDAIEQSLREDAVVRLA